MQASLILCSDLTVLVPAQADGTFDTSQSALLNAGYFRTRSPASDGRAILHVQPGVEPPAVPAVEVIRKGNEINWGWLDIKDHAEHEYILEARWNTGQTDANGNPITERGTIQRGRAIGRIPTPIEIDLPPHFWAGDV